MTEVKYNEVKKGLEITARFLQHPNTLPAFIDGFFDEHRLHWESLTSRTSGNFIHRFFLEAVRRIPVVFLGSGTVGGNAALAWFNRGGQNIKMSEPEKEKVGVENLHRQGYELADVGKHKAEARAEHMRRVDPYANIIADKHGVTKESIQQLVEQAAVVVDGVEFYRIIEVIMLHQEAAKQRKPVFVGFDLGFSDVGIWYDYARDPRPFYGMIDDLIPYAQKAQRLFEKGAITEDVLKAFVLYLASHMMPHDTIPYEQWREVEDQLDGKTQNVAQLASTGSNLGTRIADMIMMHIAGARVKQVSCRNSLDDVCEMDEAALAAKAARLKEIRTRVVARIEALGEQLKFLLDNTPEEE